MMSQHVFYKKILPALIGLFLFTVSSYAQNNAAAFAAADSSRFSVNKNAG